MTKQLLCLLLPLSLAWSMSLFAQTPADIPWNFHPDCNSMMNTGIVAMTCGTSSLQPPNERFTFGLADLNGALPAIGREDVTAQQEMYHHPAWVIDSIGNVFGLALDNCGNIYTTASSNYSSFFFTNESIIRYGEIGGGAESIEAAGTVYRIDSLTGQPTVFSVLPQQASTFEHETCEGAGNLTRTTGPALGNIVFNPNGKQFYVSNFEDGRIYRLDSLGAIIDSYDPFLLDTGAPGTPDDMTEIPYGMALTPDGTSLYFGTPVFGNIPQELSGGVYSIVLTADGGFVGAVNNGGNPAGSTWDNFIGVETAHFIDTSFQDIIFNTAFVADLAFNGAGDLLVGFRVGCFGTLHTSYNHGGTTFMLTEDGGLYNTIDGIYYTGGLGTLGNSSESYGGVDFFANPNGGLEVVASSADMVTDWDGPHGILTMPVEAYGMPGVPSTPAGLIGYLPAGSGDPKGIGGDVEVFKVCDCEQICPTLVLASTDVETICSGDVFNLNYELFGVDVPVNVTWTDENGNVIDPTNISIDHSDCAPATYTYTVTVICLEDTENILEDEVEVDVFTDDISPFITTVEEDCDIDIIIDSDCLSYLSIVGGVPDIMPGDSGTVVIDVVINGNDPCATASVELSYDCPYCPATLEAGIDATLVCSGEAFNLLTNETEFLDNVTWTNEAGDVIDPNNVTLEHTDCAPATYQFFVSANCADDTEQSYGASVEITVITDDLSPFIETLENDCEIDLNVFADCEQYLTVNGTIPTINPGDSGTVDFDISHNISPDCGTSTTLVYDCPPCAGDTTWLYRGTCLPAEEGVFLIDILTDERGCDSVIYEEVREETYILDAFTDDYEVKLGDSTLLKITVNFTPTSIIWTPTEGLSCTDCLTTMAMLINTTEYTVYMIDENGCDTEVTFRVNVDKSINLYVPNAFSPNDDGINDKFKIYTDSSVEEVLLFSIFDRWGELLHRQENISPNDPNFGWDGIHRGRLLNPQVLVYFGEVRFIDGSTGVVKGDFTLVR